MSIQIKQRYIDVRIDLEKIQTAFATLCDQAHKSGAGNVNDVLYLSYHQCPDSKELQRAQALLKTVEMAENEGCIQSSEPFKLQDEYNLFIREHERGPASDKKKGYGPGDWSNGK